MAGTVKKEAGGTREIQALLKDCREGRSRLVNHSFPMRKDPDLPNGGHDSRVLVESEDSTVQQLLHVPQHSNPCLHIGTLHPLQL